VEILSLLVHSVVMEGINKRYFGVNSRIEGFPYAYYFIPLEFVVWHGGGTIPCVIMQHHFAIHKELFL
jgi:hypothetical protein